MTYPKREIEHQLTVDGVRYRTVTIWKDDHRGDRVLEVLSNRKWTEVPAVEAYGFGGHRVALISLVEQALDELYRLSTDYYGTRNGA